MQQQREGIAMTAREQRRAQVLTRVVAGELKLWEAAVVLGLSVRQARRLKGALIHEGPAAVAFFGWPAFAVSLPRPGQPGPSPDTTTIVLWWRASDAQALYERVKAAGVPIVHEPFDGPFGRQFVLADPDGYRVTVYEKDQPLFWPPKAS
jgi:uncharacterized glyoxalase superfamily protein PhnB